MFTMMGPLFTMFFGRCEPTTVLNAFGLGFTMFFGRCNPTTVLNVFALGFTAGYCYARRKMGKQLGDDAALKDTTTCCAIVPKYVLAALKATDSASTTTAMVLFGKIVREVILVVSFPAIVIPCSIPPTKDSLSNPACLEKLLSIIVKAMLSTSVSPYCMAIVPYVAPPEKSPAPKVETVADRLASRVCAMALKTELSRYYPTNFNPHELSRDTVPIHKLPFAPLPLQVKPGQQEMLCIWRIQRTVFLAGYWEEVIVLRFSPTADGRVKATYLAYGMIELDKNLKRDFAPREHFNRDIMVPEPYNAMNATFKKWMESLAICRQFWMEYMSSLPPRTNYHEPEPPSPQQQQAEMPREEFAYSPNYFSYVNGPTGYDSHVSGSEKNKTTYIPKAASSYNTTYVPNAASRHDWGSSNPYSRGNGYESPASFSSGSASSTANQYFGSNDVEDEFGNHGHTSGRQEKSASSYKEDSPAFSCGRSPNDFAEQAASFSSKKSPPTSFCDEPSNPATFGGIPGFGRKPTPPPPGFGRKPTPPPSGYGRKPTPTPPKYGRKPTPTPPGFGPRAPPTPPGFGPNAPPTPPGFGPNAPPTPPGFGAPPTPPGFGAPPTPPGFGAPPTPPGFGPNVPPPGFGPNVPPPGFGPNVPPPGFSRKAPPMPPAFATAYGVPPPGFDCEPTSPPPPPGFGCKPRPPKTDSSSDLPGFFD